MENPLWLLVLGLGILVLVQLASIARSLRATEALLAGFLTRDSVDRPVDLEPSDRVKELASTKKTYVAAIKTYREQTGLGLKEARATIDRLAGPQRDGA